MKNDLNLLVSELKSNNNKEKINQLIENYKPFIICTVSDLKNEYIQVENDEEYSIGLLAFAEAIDRYDISKGSFLSFASLVISSRVKSFLDRKNKYVHQSLDELGYTVLDKTSAEELALREEILAFEQELSKFNIDFEDLIEVSPKHRDTRATAIDIGVKTSGEEDLVNHLYQKKRLPVTKIAQRFLVSIKIVKRSKMFITSVVVAIVNGYSVIVSWIKDKKAPKSDC